MRELRKRTIRRRVEGRTMSWCETLILVFRRTKEFRTPPNKILAAIDTVGCLGQNEGKWRTEVALLLTLPSGFSIDRPWGSPGVQDSDRRGAGGQRKECERFGEPALPASKIRCLQPDAREERKKRGPKTAKQQRRK
jgi:hypothetical protein